MNQGDLEFDDPTLKGAVQRAWGAEGAPQRLRGRISHLIATSGSIDHAPGDAPPSSAWQRWSSRAYTLAAAAVIVVGIGLLVLYYQGTFDRFGPQALYARETAAMRLEPTRTTVPLQLAQSLVATHVACGQLSDHHLIDRAAARTYGELTLKLTADLGFPAVARGIGADWRFRGAGECAVGNLRGSHLLFARGNDTVSLFSLPAHCMSGVTPGAQYDGLVDGHPVAGFSRQGAVYAVVGSTAGPSMSVQTVASIRDSLFSVFDPATCGESSTGGLDELD
jgi:hypothetical protein